MVHVIGPQQTGFKLFSPTDGFTVQQGAGVADDERVKFIGSQGAPAAGILTAARQHHINWNIYRFELTNRIHAPGSDLTQWPGDPTSEADLADGRWGIHAHSLLPDPDTGEMPLIKGNHFRWINKEHGIYICGSVRSERNIYDHCAAQGVQVWFTSPDIVGGAKPGTLGTVASDWQQYTNATLEIGSYFDRYEYCGLYHGRGRAAFACSLKAGPEGAAVEGCSFLHDHHPAGGGWLDWNTTAEPGAIMIEHRPRCRVENNSISYKGMSNRPVILIQNVDGVAKLLNNSFTHGGKIDFVNCDTVIVQGNQFTGSGPEPVVTVRTAAGVVKYKGGVTKDMAF